MRINFVEDASDGLQERAKGSSARISGCEPLNLESPPDPVRLVKSAWSKMEVAADDQSRVREFGELRFGRQTVNSQSCFNRSSFIGSIWTTIINGV